MLDLRILGASAMLLRLCEFNKIKDANLRNFLDELKGVGWFSDSVLGKFRIEVGI